jgi:hypothetical protein
MTIAAATRSTIEPETIPAAAAAALSAYVLVTIGSCLRGDILLILGLPLTIAGWSVAWIAARSADTAPEWPTEWLTLSLSALAAVGLVAPGVDDSQPWFNITTRVYFGLAIILLGVFAGSGGIGRRRTTFALAAGAVALQFAAPFGIHTQVDLWSWTQTATLALLHGVHPYTVHAPDLQHGGFDFGSAPTVYPYMPLTLIASAPAVAWLGDYRFGIACCLPVTIFLLRRAGRALGVADAPLDLLTLALVLHPRAAALTGTGYLEPLLVLTATVFVVFAASAEDHRICEATAFMMMPAIKQYVIAPVLVFVAMRGRPRAIAVGVAVAAATVLPFAFWHWRPTIDGILFFVRAPLQFRADSDSLAALVFALTGLESPRWIAIAAQFIVAAAAYRLLRDRGLEGLLLASALSLLGSFLVAPQAFTNYYSFAGALLLLSALAAAGRRRAA